MTTPKNNQPKAILFDMDGVLVNNHEYHVESWAEFNKKYHKELSKEEFNDNINGRTSYSAIRYLFGEDIEQEKVIALADEKEAIYRRIYKEHMEPVSGLKGFLDRLKRDGWLLAVATSAPTINMDFTLDGLGIRHYFDNFVNSSMVKEGKPAPDIYLKAAEVLNITPGRCIVLEDSLSGIKSGQNAGMAVIALSTTHTRQELAQSKVGWIFESFEAIDTPLLNSILDDAR